MKFEVRKRGGIAKEPHAFMIRGDPMPLEAPKAV